MRKINLNYTSSQQKYPFAYYMLQIIFKTDVSYTIAEKSKMHEIILKIIRKYIK